MDGVEEDVEGEDVEDIVDDSNNLRVLREDMRYLLMEAIQ